MQFFRDLTDFEIRHIAELLTDYLLHLLDGVTVDRE
jgi:hypothetical protein